VQISTKGRYALRIIIDLALQGGDEFISLKTISDRQEISMKYLETIISTLQKAGYVISLRGKSGGYKLSRAANEYTIGSILKITEGSLAPVACLEQKTNNCIRSAQCITLPMWQKLDRIVDDYLEGITIEDLISKENHGKFL